MESNAEVQAFWQAYCATRPDRDVCLHESYDAWSFGDRARLADELGGLVLSGTKTATAGLVWEHEHLGWKRPTVGSKIIILNGESHPVCVIAMTDVAIKPFDEVDEAFARKEGEGFESVDDWRRAHWRYFSRRCAAIGKEPNERMPVLCQQFRVIYPR